MRERRQLAIEFTPDKYHLYESLDRIRKANGLSWRRFTMMAFLSLTDPENNEKYKNFQDKDLAIRIMGDFYE